MKGFKVMTAKELKRLRAQTGLTLEEVAAMLGVFWVTVWRWENGKRKISIPMGMLIRDRLTAPAKTAKPKAKPKTKSRAAA